MCLAYKRLGSFDWIHKDHAKLVNLAANIGRAGINTILTPAARTEDALVETMTPLYQTESYIRALISLEVLFEELSKMSDSDDQSRNISEKISLIQVQCFHQHEKSVLCILDANCVNEYFISESSESLVDLVDYCMRKVRIHDEIAVRVRFSTDRTIYFHS